MTMAISTAVERGAKVVICASTGNTSASAAAYAARAGVVCAVVIPEGQIALGKLAQALIHGARVRADPGNFDDALEIVRELGERPGDRGRQLGEPGPHRGSEDGRRSRSSTRSATRPRCTASRSGNAGQHHRVLAGLLRVPRARAGRRAPRACSGGRPAARRRSCSASRCCTPRRSPPRSASATPRRGRARSRHATSRAGTSARSPTTRSSRPTGCSPPTRAASSSRRRRRRSPGSSWPRPTDGCAPTTPWCARSPATGSRTRSG